MANRPVWIVPRIFVFGMVHALMTALPLQSQLVRRMLVRVHRSLVTHALIQELADSLGRHAWNYPRPRFTVALHNQRDDCLSRLARKVFAISLVRFHSVFQRLGRFQIRCHRVPTAHGEKPCRAISRFEHPRQLQCADGFFRGAKNENRHQNLGKRNVRRFKHRPDRGRERLAARRAAIHASAEFRHALFLGSQLVNLVKAAMRANRLAVRPAHRLKQFPRPALAAVFLRQRNQIQVVRVKFRFHVD